jgi:hypothetical protein
MNSNPYLSPNSHDSHYGTLYNYTTNSTLWLRTQEVNYKTTDSERMGAIDSKGKRL